ncbi:hypothetical protein ACEWY4_011254 [Coilia grayii]|uniref:Metalloendopeptidase n=1 Tax=Coilia grayii TaxID=363190 RepID=A0ABD1K485_9TELE
MSIWKISVSLLALLLVSFTRAEDPEGTDLSVSEIIEKANRNIVRGAEEPFVIDDIAYDSEEEYGRNADPCTVTGCLWDKSADGNIYVPYKIHDHYSDREEAVIRRALESIKEVSCIRFIPRTGEKAWIHILSLSGCYSHVGRRGGEQTLSLNRQGCVYHHTVQHELLHALGFNHEQTRSDRDNHIKILYENINPMMAYNFDKIDTLNQDTPYDYNSVMQYHRTAFSVNGQPTMVPIPDPNVDIGKAREMSKNDILRLNRLYKCQNKGETSIVLLVKMFAQIILGVFVLSSAWAEEVGFEDNSVSGKIERANRNVVRGPDEPLVEDDIAYASEAERNADPCTSSSCMWPMSGDGRVYVPYVIANQYSDRELAVIERGLQSFSSSTCIRFFPRYNERDYIHIQSLNGCYSSVGRRGNSQTLSLSRSGCVYYDTVQHELLHALGFNHEQTRSDRDNHIRVLLENVISGKEHNFRKINTLNQGTPYDYNSIMHYHRYAFSKNNQPTLVPIPDPNVEIGMATEMSYNDILRVNRLYQC